MNKKFFKHMVTGISLIGTGLSLMQTQMNNVVSANEHWLPPVVVAWAGVIEKKIREGGNLFNAGFYDGILRMVWFFKSFFGLGKEDDKKMGIDSFKKYKRSMVDSDFKNAARDFSKHLRLKALEFQFLLEDLSVEEKDKRQLKSIIKGIKIVCEKLKILECGEDCYDEGLYNKILDCVVDKAAIVTDWDAILIDTFCKDQIFDGDKDRCEAFFANCKDKRNRYFVMGDEFYKRARKSLGELREEEKLEPDDIETLDAKDDDSFAKRELLKLYYKKFMKVPTEGEFFYTVDLFDPDIENMSISDI